MFGANITRETIPCPKFAFSFYDNIILNCVAITDYSFTQKKTTSSVVSVEYYKIVTSQKKDGSRFFDAFIRSYC